MLTGVYYCFALETTPLPRLSANVIHEGPLDGPRAWDSINFLFYLMMKYACVHHNRASAKRDTQCSRGTFNYAIDTKKC